MKEDIEVMEVEGGTRFSIQSAPRAAIDGANAYLKRFAGCEPKSIIYGSNRNQLSISFILKPPEGDKIWQFTSSDKFSTLDFLSSKEATSEFINAVWWHIGIKK